ncbi:MAG: hypothetical protein D8M58_00360 [Calditrichaeota bacterium]|nr:MAG: hypothetical protein DWQ03_06720 [Calditrichota bacterium]MBL1203822.1 hypothetical protein [Calditrichota bacterium]NOG43653.1 hypothetical protein [Calditrichota bacterium]
MNNIVRFSFFAFLFLVSCDVNINKDFVIPDNTTVENDLISVNGNINIGENCIVEANLSTVNGNIEIKKFTRIESSIQTVNGNISIIEKVKVDGDITSLTGLIEINNSTVVGNVSNISGDIEVNKIELDGDLISNFGKITIENNSEINGSVVIKANDEIPEKLRNVKIIISDSSVIQGDLVNDNRDVIVSVFIEEGSSIYGEIIDADLVDQIEDLDYK